MSKYKHHGKKLADKLEKRENLIKKFNENHLVYKAYEVDNQLEDASVAVTCIDAGRIAYLSVYTLEEFVDVFDSSEEGFGDYEDLTDGGEIDTDM